MRTLSAVILLIAWTIGDACSIAALIETECERDPSACVRRDLRDLYERSDVVFEVTVQKVSKPFRHGRSRSMNSVQVEHIWKSDGKPLDLIAAGWGGGDCSVALSPGTSYVIFADRTESFWAFLPWVREPLYAGINSTFLPTDFRAQSQYHVKFYESKTPQALRLLLQELAQ